MENERVIPMPELSKLTSLSPATIYRWMKDGHFPAPIQLGPNRVGWLASEVQEWLTTRRRAAVPVSVEEA
jgi:prophage regulatory protein